MAYHAMGTSEALLDRREAASARSGGAFRFAQGGTAVKLQSCDRYQLILLKMSLLGC